MCAIKPNVQERTRANNSRYCAAISNFRNQRYIRQSCHALELQFDFHVRSRRVPSKRRGAAFPANVNTSTEVWIWPPGETNGDNKWLFRAELTTCLFVTRPLLSEDLQKEDAGRVGERERQRAKFGRKCFYGYLLQ